MNIASYYARVGFKVNNRDIQKVDRAISTVEKKLKDFSKRLSASYTINLVNFNVNERNLQRSLGNALDMASSRVAFEISRFVVNDRALLAALLRAARRLPPPPPPGPNPPPHPPGPGPRPNGGGNPPPGSGRGSRSLIGAGLYGPLGYGALALAGGGYGLGALNRRNQEVVSAQLQSQAVVQQAGGTVQQGQESFQWLRNQANRIGFNYLDASPDYNKLLSGLTGAGMSVKQGQDVYKGFAELSRVNKLDRIQQQRVFRALSQIAGKNKLQSEELSGQLAESLPGAVSLFARAYQQQIGGNKTGQEAITQLLDAMKKGQVKGNILTYAGTLASQQAAPSLAAAGTASQAEQARYQNAVSDLAVVASNAGVEEGFARIFRTLNAGLSESNGLVEMLARGFNDATKWADDLLLFPQDFARALEGRDSLVADWLGADATKQLQEDWKSIKESMQTISTIGAPSWLPTMESVSKDIAAQFRVIAALANGDFSEIGSALTDFAANRYKQHGDALATGPNFALRAIGTALDTPVPQISFSGGPDSFAPKSVMDLYGLGNNPSSGDSTTYGLFDKGQLGPKESNAFGLDPSKLDFNIPTNEFDKSFIGNDAKSITTTNEFNIQLNVDAATLGGIDIEVQAQQLAQAFATNLEQVAVFFPNKE